MTISIETIVDKHVYCSAAAFVNHLMNGDDDSLQGDLQDVMDKPDYREAPEGYFVEYNERIESWSFEEDVDEDSLQTGFETEEDATKAAWEDSGDEPEARIEALQHFIVSDWLAMHLKDIGALVHEDILGLCIWGRTECGQALKYDGDLNAVADKLK